VEQFAEIRRDHRIEGLSIRALADKHGVHRRTVRQALESAIPPPRKVPCDKIRYDNVNSAVRSEPTVRSYGMDLLRWFRFLWAIEVPWQRATRIEARDFSRWMLVAGKPLRPHWRRPTVVPKTTQRKESYSTSVRAHSETVLRSFHNFHLDAGTGPVVNPFPLDRARRGRRAHAHHNPMEPHRNERKGLYRPSVPSRIPRSIPDEEFNEIFARCHRIVIARWWRSMCPPGRGPRSCFQLPRVVPTQAGAWLQ
jgi:hypothetical protein